MKRRRDEIEEDLDEEEERYYRGEGEDETYSDEDYGDAESFLGEDDEDFGSDRYERGSDEEDIHNSGFSYDDELGDDDLGEDFYEDEKDEEFDLFI